MREELEGTLWDQVRPILIAFGLIGIGGWLFSWDLSTREEASNEERLKAVGVAMLGTLFVIAGAGVLLFPLGRWLSSLFEGIFWPADRSVAPAQHKLPEWYIRQGRYAESQAEYEKMVKNHPNELEAHMGLLYVLRGCMGNGPEADKVLRRGLKKLGSEQAAALEAYDRLLREGGAEPPSFGGQN
ncbi:MAG: hypothetical protein HC904_15470 [Blastochloris sp.]|nr:hypothetical protein [Blastochloris sp.]